MKCGNRSHVRSLDKLRKKIKPIVYSFEIRILALALSLVRKIDRKIDPENDE